jgi:purine nucleoside phosphorylase
VTHVSQTGGPEAVLCGEAELPYALLGYATDYANGVTEEATPVQTLLDMMAASTATFASVLAAAAPRAAGAQLAPAGTVYRFEGA